ncbi:MAG: cation:proton antiporter [Candidatus Diapherotrites archaeon]
MELFLVLGALFLLTFLIGQVVEKIRVPWIFAALLIGTVLAAYNPVGDVTSSEPFIFLAQMGMYFLLFVIGFEIDLAEFRKAGAFILKSTFFIILLEAVFGSLLIHFVFGYDWAISAIVALSFATVGEAILIPILDEFGIVNTRLGQSIIGIGTLDDIIEVAMLIVVIMLVGSQGAAQASAGVTLVSLFVLSALAVVLMRLGKSGRKFMFHGIEMLFLFVLFVLFLFLGVGEYANAGPIAALLAGISLKAFVPKERLQAIESEVKTMCYGFFAPVFFLWVGLSLDIGYLLAFPLLVLAVVVVSNSAKILGSYIMARKELGTRQSILLGIGLSVRFSTSIIIVKILLDNGLIGAELYSVIVASSIVFKFVVPVLFSNLLVKWGVSKGSTVAG